MARRQTIPLTDVRAPTYVDDQMTQIEVRQGASKAETAQDFVNIIASQLRLAQGGRGWLEPPGPGVGTGTIDLRNSLVVGELLGGERDGANVIYRTNRYFLAFSIAVKVNGLELTYGAAADYVTLESRGLGTGYDTVKLTGALPLVNRDRITASYIRAA